ncbi:hypothetical protein, partial [Salmonella sp. s60131]|uniref:hypothetical protein n=1 Tax=Salmonella sp. s60131 TaxID=3159722 RepID=UPI0039802AA9
SSNFLTQLYLLLAAVLPVFLYYVSENGASGASRTELRTFLFSISAQVLCKGNDTCYFACKKFLAYYKHIIFQEIYYQFLQKILTHRKIPPAAS